MLNNDLNKEKDEQVKRHIGHLEGIIKEAQKEIDELRDSCRHTSVSIKDINPEGGSTLRKVCDVCGRILGYPGHSDLEEYRKG